MAFIAKRRNGSGPVWPRSGPKVPDAARRGNAGKVTSPPLAKILLMERTCASECGRKGSAEGLSLCGDVHARSLGLFLTPFAGVFKVRRWRPSSSGTSNGTTERPPPT